MLKVTFEFKTPEEAITAIAKIAGLGAAAPAPRLEIRKPQDIEGESRREPDVQPQPGGKKDRKPRADKGRERGAYKPRENANPAVEAGREGGMAGAGHDAGAGVPDARKADAAATGTSTPPASVSAPETALDGATKEASPPALESQAEQSSGLTVPVPSAATVASEADVQKALEKVFGAKGLPAAQAVLSKFGVSRGRDLAPEKRAEFIQAAEEACK
jgi:hypothetical protein